MPERNIYLHDVALDQALDAWHALLDENGQVLDDGLSLGPVTVVSP